MRISRLPLTLLVLAGSFQAATAQTVTVTTASDTIDINASTGTVAELPGPDGVVSFSEALIATNNTPGHQTIEFGIPGSGSVLLSSITGYYWRAYDTVTIDASTQPGNVSLWRWDLYLNADDCTLIGFDGGEVTFTQSRGLATGNAGLNINLSGPGGHRVEGNTGGTIKISGACDDNVLVGNTVQRIRVQGGSDNVVGGPNPEDRNFITGYGTWNISSGLPSGTAFQISGTTGLLVENNYIGTTVDGLAQGNAACTLGVSIEGGNDDLVVRDNLIAGIKAVGIGTWAGRLFGNAVILWGSGGSNIEITGNTIGLDASGEPLLGSVWGIDVGTANGSGLYTGVNIEDNVVAGHVLNGITIGRQIQDTRVSQNSIHSNGWIGIDLIPTGFGTGVTLNDPLDPDTGGNGLQNFPLLSSASNTGGFLRLTGTLNSTALDDFTLEFFASSVCDPSGFGQGQRYLGAAAVTTDGAGDAAFDVTLATSVPTGWYVTATATLEPLGSTSEFSACVQAVDLFCQQDLGFGGPGNALMSLCGGDLSAGTTGEMRLANAEPNRLAILAIGSTYAPTPIFGGTLVPFPPSQLLVYVTDGAGALTVPVPGGGGPRTFYAQIAYSDPALPGRWGISNALQVEFLP